MFSVEPEMIERRCGGWLAITPQCIAVRIGAVGSSRDEARRNFDELIRKWQEARESERGNQA